MADEYIQSLIAALQDPKQFQEQFAGAGQDFETEEAAARQRMAMARALMGAQNSGASGPGATPVSSILGGLGQLAKGVRGGFMQDGAEQQLRALLAQKEAAAPGKFRLGLAKEALLRRAAMRPVGVQQITGDDGVVYDIGGGVAKPIHTEQGQPFKRLRPAPKADKPPPPLPKAERDELQTLTNDAEAASTLLSGFRPEFAGGGPLQAAKIATAQTAGSLAPDGWQPAAQWWSNFAMLADLPARNKTFGSSLTPGEKASWENAKNIKPGVSQDVVQKQLQTMEAIKQKVLARRSESLKADNYNPAAIDALTGAGRHGSAVSPAPVATPKKIRDPKTGRTGTWDGVSPLPPGVEVVDG